MKGFSAGDMMSVIRVWLVGGLEKWNDRKWEKNDRKILIFSRTYLVGRMEKWRKGKPICLVKKKNEMMKKKLVHIYSYVSIKQKKKKKKVKFFLLLKKLCMDTSNFFKEHKPKDPNGPK